MTTIHEHNCEAFFLDYYEGRLDDHQRELLWKFLGENPEWENVFNEYGEVADSDVVVNSQLEESMPDSEYPIQHDEEIDLIALLEGQLNHEDARIIQKKIARDTDLAIAFRKYEWTRLKPDLSIGYPNKNDLKKGAPILALFAKYSAVAALMAGAFIAVWIFSVRETATPVAEYDPRTIESGSALASDLSTEEQVSAIQVAPMDESSAADKMAIESSGDGNTSEIHHDNSQAEKPVRSAIQSGEKTAAEHSQIERVALVSMKVKTPPIAALANVNPETPQLVKTDLPGMLPEPRPIRDNSGDPAPSQSLFGAFLSDLGQKMVNRVKAATDDEVVIENEEYPEDELVTSTFKLGAFEVYRSKSKK